MGVVAVGRTVQSDLDTVTAAVIAVLAVGPHRTVEVPAPDGPCQAGTVLGAACGQPSLACWDEGTVGISAATESCGHTLAPVENKARVTQAAFSASGRGMACALAEALWVRAGRGAGRQAAAEEAVGRALQSDFDTVAAAVFVVLALSP